MGFALWLIDRQAFAAGTHEYQPMGTAVIAATQLFRARDFSCGQRHRAARPALKGYLLRSKTSIAICNVPARRLDASVC